MVVHVYIYKKKEKLINFGVEIVYIKYGVCGISGQNDLWTLTALGYSENLQCWHNGIKLQWFDTKNMDQVEN